jgi:N-acetylmuramate 1-kinase
MLSESERADERRIDPSRLRNYEDHRLMRMVEWLETVVPDPVVWLEPASGDASFRRYFRLNLKDHTLIAMDAPPESESIRSFIAVSRLFGEAGVHVPKIIDFDTDHGFMVLEDLGATNYLSRLDLDTALPLYRDATDVLRLLQSKLDIETSGLPDYGTELLTRELNLFEEWFLDKRLGIRSSAAEKSLLEDAKRFLVGAVLEQPKVVVHRDFHSRNLMVVERRNPGVLDFQDAVNGPLTYDLVSLFRDCYIAWPDDRVCRWVKDYCSSLNLSAIGFEQFYRWFDLTGLQRHLKAVGIFSRLDIRDGKPGYLADIPRTFAYILEVSGRYAELSGFRDFLTTTVAERMDGLSVP